MADNPVTEGATQAQRDGNFNIDHYATWLAAGLLFLIILVSAGIDYLAHLGLPDGAPQLAPALAKSAGQAALVDEVNRQLEVWLGLSRNFEFLSMVMGASAAALTVIVGFIREHTKAKMFLMAVSAAFSVITGAVNPGEKATNFMNAWRALYADVNAINAKSAASDADFNKLAETLSQAGTAVSPRLTLTVPPASAPAPAPAPAPAKDKTP